MDPLIVTLSWEAEERDVVGTHDARSEQIEKRTSFLMFVSLGGSSIDCGL